MKTNETKEEKSTKKEADKAAQDYSGVAVNIADDGKVSEKLEKERTCTLNNNRNNDQL